MKVSAQEREAFESCHDQIQNDFAGSLYNIDIYMTSFWRSTYHSHIATHRDNEKASTNVLDAWKKLANSYGISVTTSSDAGYRSTLPDLNLASQFTLAQQDQLKQNLRKASDSFMSGQETEIIEGVEVVKQKPKSISLIKPWMWGMVGSILTGVIAYTCA